MTTYALEWSEAQGCFHIDEAKHLADKNLNMVLGGQFPQYVTIFLGSLAECNRMADKLQYFKGLKINDRKPKIAVLA